MDLIKELTLRNLYHILDQIFAHFYFYELKTASEVSLEWNKVILDFAFNRAKKEFKFGFKLLYDDLYQERSLDLTLKRSTSVFVHSQEYFVQDGNRF